MHQNFSNVNTNVGTLKASFPSLYNESSSCSRCGSNEFLEILLPPNHVHYAEIKCANCGKHERWQKDPAISEAYHERIILIDKLLATNKTNSWETTFLKDIRKPRFLTGRQPVKLSQICKRLLPDISAKPEEYDEIVDWLWGDAP